MSGSVFQKVTSKPCREQAGNWRFSWHKHYEIKGDRKSSHRLKRRLDSRPQETA
jgi:hypothetical protein